MKKNGVHPIAHPFALVCALHLSNAQLPVQAYVIEVKNPEAFIIRTDQAGE